MLVSDGKIRERGSALKILRVAAGARAVGVLQSDKFAFLAAHWAGRLVLCPGDECSLCSRLPVRCYGYAVAVIDDGVRTSPMLVEATPGAVERFVERSMFEQVTFGSGLGFEATRRFKRSPLVLSPIEGGRSVDPALADPNRLARALATIYALPHPSKGQSMEQWAMSVEAAVRAKALGVASSLD